MMFSVLVVDAKFVIVAMVIHTDAAQLACCLIFALWSSVVFSAILCK